MTTPPSASNTIIKIKAIPSGERLKLDAAINGIISKEIYRFDNNGEVIIPFQ